jgi:hypothetical protein
MGLNRILIEANTHVGHLNVRTLASTSIPFKPTHDGANVKFSTNCDEMDYSVSYVQLLANSEALYIQQRSEIFKS